MAVAVAVVTCKADVLVVVVEAAVQVCSQWFSSTRSSTSCCCSSCCSCNCCWSLLVLLVLLLPLLVVVFPLLLAPVLQLLLLPLVLPILLWIRRRDLPSMSHAHRSVWGVCSSRYYHIAVDTFAFTLCCRFLSSCHHRYHMHFVLLLLLLAYIGGCIGRMENTMETIILLYYNGVYIGVTAP